MVNVDRTWFCFFFSSRRRHTRLQGDWSSDVCSSDLEVLIEARIVEAATSFARQAGIQWGGNVSFSPTLGNPTGLIFPSILSVAGAADDPAAPTAGLFGPVSGGIGPAGTNFAATMPAP